MHSSMQHDGLMLVARLLEYPDSRLWEAREEIGEALASVEALPESLHQAFKDFAEILMRTELLEAQAAYVETFEYGRATSLLLFEHVYGESRERGQAMVDLQEAYRQVGLSPHSRELPDYLPLYLEYLSVLPKEKAQEQLLQFEAALSLLAARLHHRQSSYAVLFDVLLAFCGKQVGEGNARTNQVGNELPDNTPAAIDAVWQETQVSFGAPAQCGANMVQGSQQPVFWGLGSQGKASPPSLMKH